MTNIALIWASSNPEKYGNKILLDLVWKGFVVYPINPKSEYINDIKTFKSISEIPNKIDIFNFVVQPEVTLKILISNKDKLLDKQLWFQPWSTNNEVEDYLKNNNFKYYKINSCIMVNKI
jgi:predicted CoA-binding protein